MTFTGIGHNRSPHGAYRPKNCHCYTCGRDIHHLGIMSHRAMHRRRQENCTVMFSNGNVVEYQFAPKHSSVNCDTSQRDDDNA